MTWSTGRERCQGPLRCVCHASGCLCALLCSPQVREILGQCNCPAQFPMVKVSEGKYKVGDSSALIFIRVSHRLHLCQFFFLLNPQTATRLLFTPLAGVNRL